MILFAEILRVLAYFIFILITAVYIRQLQRIKSKRKLTGFEKNMEILALLGFWFIVISFGIERFTN